MVKTRKHIRVRYHWIRDLILDEEIKLEHVSTADNIADTFTKNIGFSLRQHLLGDYLMN